MNKPSTTTFKIAITKDIIGNCFVSSLFDTEPQKYALALHEHLKECYKSFGSWEEVFGTEFEEGSYWIKMTSVYNPCTLEEDITTTVEKI